MTIQQATLFDIEQDKTVSYEEVVDVLQVSEATVRNWVKTGYLKQVGKKLVTKKSFDIFLKDIAGKEKLTKRANKSLVDNHDHEVLADITLGRLKSGANPDNVAIEYEAALSNAYKNKEGVYYTPSDICRTLVTDCPHPTSSSTFCDPCCGSGNFILAAIRHGFQPENVYGYDVDPVAVEITKHRIKKLTGCFSDNIRNVNFLEYHASIRKEHKTFDAIVTNPPWGKKLSKSEKSKYAGVFDASRSMDTCSLFFFASLLSLKRNGFLALLLPESFFNIATFQAARSALLQQTVISIRDFGKPFKGLLTRAQSFAMIKNEKPSLTVTCYDVAGAFFERSQQSFSKNPVQIINSSCSPGEADVIYEVFHSPHITLEGNAKWGLGIVTGNNKKFCTPVPTNDSMPVYKGSDVQKDYLSNPTNFIPKDLNLYQQVSPVELFEAQEKILYRFISSHLVFYHDKKQAYFLNSVNMIVLKNGFPFTTAQVVNLFNTELYSWIFSKIFNTRKVLRSDLEKMPIPTEFLNNNEIFTEQDLLDYYHIERTNNGTYRVKV
jgi:site-specific DNA-methyltransferase (adenine-specific)